MIIEEKRSKLRSAVEYSFLFTIFSLGFMQPSLEIEGFPIPVTDLAFVFTAIIWFLALLLRKIEFRFDKSFFLFGLYAVGLLLSAIFSEQPRSSLIKYLGELYLIGLAVMAFNLAATENLLKKTITAWLAASLVVGLAGLLTVAFFYLGTSNFITDFSRHHYGTLPPGNYTRIQSTFVYPAMLCNYLTVSLMMLLAARKLGWVNSTLFALLLILFSVTIAFTVTPGIGGVLLAVGVWFWLVFKDRGRPVVSRIALSGGIISALSFLLVSTFSVFSPSTSPYFFSIGGMRIDPTPRLLVWQGAAQTFLEHPVFGKGLGVAVAAVFYASPSNQNMLLTDAHNILLGVAAQAGIFGAIPLILICLVVLKRSRPFLIDAEEVSVIKLCLGIAFISGFLYQGIVGSFENARHLWVLIGLILAANSLTKPDQLPGPANS